MSILTHENVYLYRTLYTYWMLLYRMYIKVNIWIYFASTISQKFSIKSARPVILWHAIYKQTLFCGRKIKQRERGGVIKKGTQGQLKNCNKKKKAIRQYWEIEDWIVKQLWSKCRDNSWESLPPPSHHCILYINFKSGQFFLTIASEYVVGC